MRRPGLRGDSIKLTFMPARIEQHGYHLPLQLALGTLLQLFGDPHGGFAYWVSGEVGAGAM